jgi:hypothetical protein
MIAMALNGKNKYLSNFDYFSLWSNTLFGLLDCDYTQLGSVCSRVGQDGFLS